jgi:acyl carrier protein
MESAAIYSKLNTIFRDVFDDETIVVVPTLSAQDVPEWDSLSHIRLIVAIEVAFEVRFSTTEIAGLTQVGDLVKLLQTKI